MAKKQSLKEKGDQELLTLLGKLQKKIMYEKSLNQLTLDESEDNLIATKILHAKYNFLYREARLRHAHSKSPSSVISN